MSHIFACPKCDTDIDAERGFKCWRCGTEVPNARAVVIATTAERFAEVWIRAGECGLKVADIREAYEMALRSVTTAS